MGRKGQESPFRNCCCVFNIERKGSKEGLPALSKTLTEQRFWIFSLSIAIPITYQTDNQGPKEAPRQKNGTGFDKAWQ
jgi:hypothetical protein